MSKSTKLSASVEYNLGEICTASQEILELLLQPNCQKPQVVTEVEIILEAVQNIRKNLPSQ